MRQGALLGGQAGILLPQLFQRRGKVFLHLCRFHGFKLKYRTAAENGVVDVEIRVFGGRGNEGNGAVLDVFQQCLLLFFIQVLDLIQIQHHTAHGVKAAQFGNKRLDIPGRGGCAIETVELFAGARRNDARGSGFPHAGRPVKDEIG